jgi:aspartyl-tRNA(Asn)/glutamyl-tRNA(Gln) amidotransferase subunit A
VPRATAKAVLLLEDGGWSNAGKANLHEFAYGITSQNPHYGTVPNPIAPGRVAGGSSGGCAAALAAGLVEGALGSDSGGSIRIPAAWCGVVGFKPSFGLVSTDGCFPLAPSFDHAGPMARDVATCIEMMQALAPGFEPARIDALAELRIAVAGGIELAGAEPVELPSDDGGVGGAFRGEVAEVHAELFAEHRELYGDNVATKVEQCLQLSDAEHETGLRRRAELRESLAGLLERFDILLTPTVPLEPPPADVDELSVRDEAISFTFPFNAIGAPALALPHAGAGPAGSLQVVAAPGNDALVLAAGELLERLGV